LSDQDLLERYPKFLADFYNHPEAKDYLEYVKDRWENLSFAQITDAYQNFQENPSKKTVTTLLETSTTYLKNQSKRQSAATHTQRFSKWHLDTATRPIQLIIDQGQKLYVQVIHNDNIYVETKRLGSFTSITVPHYRSSDRLIIKGYQDDRFDDTQLDQTLSINSFKGNHNLTLSDQRGTVNVQVVFEDYPKKPPM
ncbi:MAG: hypothetical protein HOH77_07945, partial [Candidatus Latescibacteria bacterium]|nr:hypothetical protein [Candidatus Latescibacterota bacterium]